MLDRAYPCTATIRKPSSEKVRIGADAWLNKNQFFEGSIKNLAIKINNYTIHREFLTISNKKYVDIPVKMDYPIAQVEYDFIVNFSNDTSLHIGLMPERFEFIW